MLQADKQQSINKMAVPAHSSPQATTLATRNTDQVIADLKRLSDSGPVGSPFSPKRRLTSYASTRSEPTLSGLPEAPVYLGANAPLGPDDGDEDEPNESSDEEEAQRTAKPRKITEQKRRHNAVFDSYMHERTQKQLKESNKVRPEDEAQQSARWLVNQSENREIISSPREYQVELFEKAKEKNIIAVLDTGTCLLTQFGSSC
jgi:endoribonuclease Dicer